MGKAIGPASSPKYKEILKVYEDNLEALLKEELIRNDFFHKFIVPIDGDIVYASYARWIGRRLAEDKHKLTQKTVADKLPIGTLVTEENVQEIVTIVARDVRNKAKWIFNEKLEELINDPDMLQGMKISEARKLYAEIRKEEDREREIRMKEEQGRQKSALGFLALGALTGQLSLVEVNSLKKLANERIQKSGDYAEESGGESEAEGERPDNSSSGSSDTRKI